MSRMLRFPVSIAVVVSAWPGIGRALRTLALYCAALGATAAASQDHDEAGHRPALSALATGSFPLRSTAMARAAGSLPLLWQRRSPEGADLRAVAYSPTRAGAMLAGGLAAASGLGSGLYRSDDGGAHWQAVPGLEALAVYDIEFDARGGAYLATADGLLYRAGDAGAWKALPLGIGPHDAVLDIALDPQQPGTVWIGIDEALGLQPILLMQSTDGGRHWLDRTPRRGMPMGCRQIAIDPGDRRRMAAVFAGSFGHGQVWVSEDAGAHWTNRSDGLPDRPLLSAAFAGSRLLVGGGQRLGGAYLGLYGSDDDGRHWMPMHDPGWASPLVSTIAVSAADPRLIWIGTDADGVRRSRDGGHSWSAPLPGTASTHVASLRIVPNTGAWLAAATSAPGLLVSRDGGEQFAAATTGMHGLAVHAVAVDPTDAAHLAVAVNGLNEGRVHSSRDGGLSWQLEALPATRFNRLQFDAGGTLYAASGGPSSTAPEGLYRREGAGHWTSLGPDQGALYETDVLAIDFGIADRSVILLAGADHGSAAGFEGTLWRSADGGTHWSKVHESSGSGAFVDLVSVPTPQPRRLAVFDDDSGARAGRLLRSIDEGVSWQRAGAGLPEVFSAGRLCASAARPGVVYLAAGSSGWQGQLFRSEDGGDHWQARGTAGDWISDIACDPDDADALYVLRDGGVARRRVEFSRDGGASFLPADAAIEAPFVPRELVLSRDRDGRVQLFLASSRGAWLARP